MMSGAVPPNLKAIAHYVKIGHEHSTRDPAVAYWCMLYAAQTAMKIDKTSPDCKQFLSGLVSFLEQMKMGNKQNEAISNDVVAQAHIEEVALKLFHWADAQDRAGQFDKNTVKAFYTSGYLFDVLQLFETELDENLKQQRKYAKFKAAYIHNCLKNGEIPKSGPLNDAGEPIGGLNDEMEGLNLNVNNFNQPTFTTTHNQFNNLPSTTVAPNAAYGFTSESGPNQTWQQDGHSASFNQNPSNSDASQNALSTSSASIATTGVCVKVQKMCKEVISSLDYEDLVTAKTKLQQALQLLNTISQ